MMYNTTSNMDYVGHSSTGLIDIILLPLAFIVMFVGIIFIIIWTLEAYKEWKISIVKKGTLAALREFDDERND